MRYVANATAVLLLGILTGCAHLRASEEDDKESAEQVSRVDSHSSYPAVRRGNFEAVNLLELVDPAQNAAKHYPAAWYKAKAQDRFDLLYDLALAAFRESPQSPELKRLHRNGVQDRILGVSTSRCNVFKTYLRRQQADANFYLGSSATVAGVLGALLPGANASRNLAGVAGILSGVQAEYNSTYYSNLAAHVIVQGIEVHQSRLLATLVDERQRKSVDDYSMEAAIRDAIYFDGTCSTVVGLLEASESIKEAVNPGLSRAMQVIGAVKATAEAVKTNDFKAFVASGEWERLNKITQLTASPLVVSQVQTASGRTLVTRLSRAQGAKAELTRAVDQAATALTAAQEQALKTLAEDAKNKAVKPAELGSLFKEKVNDQLAKQLALDACVKAMLTPAADYGQAQFSLLAAPAGTGERTNAEKELLLKQARLDAALTEVEMQATEAHRLVNLAHDAWMLAIRLSQTGLAKDQTPESLATAPAHLKEACK